MRGIVPMYLKQTTRVRRAWRLRSVATLVLARMVTRADAWVGRKLDRLIAEGAPRRKGGGLP